MKISRTVAYALRATLILAAQLDHKPVPCSRLANLGGMPERFLLQILRSLVNHGVLRSARGVDGGYTLADAPERISMLQVIEALEGPVGCEHPLEESFPDVSEGPVRTAIRRVSEGLRRQLAEVSFAMLLADASAVENALDAEEHRAESLASVAPAKPR